MKKISFFLCTFIFISILTSAQKIKSIQHIRVQQTPIYVIPSPLFDNKSIYLENSEMLTNIKNTTSISFDMSNDETFETQKHFFSKAHLEENKGGLTMYNDTVILGYSGIYYEYNSGNGKSNQTYMCWAFGDDNFLVTVNAMFDENDRPSRIAVKKTMSSLYLDKEAIKRPIIFKFDTAHSLFKSVANSNKEMDFNLSGVEEEEPEYKPYINVEQAGSADISDITKAIVKKAHVSAIKDTSILGFYAKKIILDDNDNDKPRKMMVLIVQLNKKTFPLKISYSAPTRQYNKYLSAALRLINTLQLREQTKEDVKAVIEKQKIDSTVEGDLQIIQPLNTE